MKVRFYGGFDKYRSLERYLGTMEYQDDTTDEELEQEAEDLARETFRINSRFEKVEVPNHA